MTLPTVDVLSQLIETSKNYLIYFLIIVLVGILAFSWWKGIWFFKRFFIQVHILQKRGLGYRMKHDTARLIKENGKDMYEFKRGNFKQPASEFGSILADDSLLVFENVRGRYDPAPIKDDGVHSADDFTLAGVMLSNQVMENKYRFDYKSFLKEYMPYIMFAVAAIMVIILFWQVSNSLGQAMGAAQVVANQQAAMLDKLMNMSRQVAPYSK